MRNKCKSEDDSPKFLSDLSMQGSRYRYVPFDPCWSPVMGQWPTLEWNWQARTVTVPGQDRPGPGQGRRWSLYDLERNLPFVSAGHFGQKPVSSRLQDPWRPPCTSANKYKFNNVLIECRWSHHFPNSDTIFNLRCDPTLSVNKSVITF
jgi:hypothetical protein